MKVGMPLHWLEGEKRGIGRHTSCLVDALQKQGVEIVRPSSSADIIHLTMPTFLDILLLLLPGVKRALTIHDLGSLTAKRFKRRMRAKALYTIIRLLKGRLDKVIVVSHFTKEEVMQYLKIPEHKICVIPNAPHDKFRPLNIAREEVILSVGPINVAVFKSILTSIKERGLKHQIIVVGNYPIYSEIENYANIKGLNNVKFVGFVTDEDLVKLYNKSALLIYSAKHPGFGIPPLEAMACGCPVIASNSGALPEVIGDAGILANPHDVNDWANSIYAVLTDESMRKDLVDRGSRHVKQFSWEETAKQTLKVYEDIYSK